MSILTLGGILDGHLWKGTLSLLRVMPWISSVAPHGGVGRWVQAGTKASDGQVLSAYCMSGAWGLS